MVRWCNIRTLLGIHGYARLRQKIVIVNTGRRKTTVIFWGSRFSTKREEGADVEAIVLLLRPESLQSLFRFSGVSQGQVQPVLSDAFPSIPPSHRLRQPCAG